MAWFNNKFKFFFLLALALGWSCFHYLSEAYTKQAGHTVFANWAATGDNLLVVILLGCVFGFVFAATLSDRLEALYYVYFGEADVYVYIGDYLEKGFCAYREGDNKKKTILIPQLFGTSKPSGYFQGLFRRMAMVRGKDDYLINLQNQNTTRLVMFSLINIGSFGFSIICMLIIIKTYSYYFVSSSPLSNDISLDDVLLLSYGQREIVTSLMILVSLNVISLALLRWRVMHITNLPKETSFAKSIPDHIVPGHIISGKVVDRNYYTTSSSKGKIARKHCLYLIHIHEGFDPAVYLNYTVVISANGGSRADKEKIKLLEQAYKTHKPLLFQIVHDENYLNLLTIELVPGDVNKLSKLENSGELVG